MPRVPVLSEPQADTRPLPTPYGQSNLPGEAFGAGIGEAVEGIAPVAMHLAMQARQRANTAAVLGGIGQAKQALNDVILDPEKGYVSLKGDDALKGRSPALQKFTQAVDQAGESISDVDARQHYQRLASTIKEEGYRHIVSHESVQIEDLAQAKFHGAADQTVRALQAPSVVVDPVSLQKQMIDLEGIATVEAKRRFGANAPPEALQAVVGPTMQKGAIDAMEAAIASQDPRIAQSTFGQVGRYLGTHDRFYAKAVDALTNKTMVEATARRIVTEATVPVAVPGGDPISRIDGTKLAAGLAALPADSPHLADVVKATEVEEARRGKVWNGVTANVVARIQTAGTDPATGVFSLSSPNVSAVDRLWLQQNAPDKLMALRGQDVRAQRQDNLADRQISAGNYNNLIAKMIDPAARKQVFGPQTPEEFKSALLDEDAYPGGFTDQDTKRALQAFAKLKQDVGKLEEPVPAAVREILGAAFKNNPIAAKDYVGPLHDALQAFVDSEKAKHNGVAPGQAEVRKYGEQELAKGAVTAVGSAVGFFDFNNVRRVEFQTKPEYAGKQFNPKEGGPAELRVAPAPPAAAVPAATGPAAHPLPATIQIRAPSDQDLAAVEWLQKNPNSPDAPAVRAKLKTKGIE